MRRLTIVWLVIVLSPLALAREIMGNVSRRTMPRTAASCSAPSSSIQLDINNVRCLIHNGGDMWWDIVSNPRYEIPKVPPGVPAIHSMFAGAIWVGGYDAGGRLRLAAQTYRQSGIDFFAGPLTLQGTTDASACQRWDRHFLITRQEINDFLSAFQANPNNLNLGNYPNITSWPAINSDPGFERFLAPFVDVNNDGDYTPSAGDYPDVLGDMAIWWVYNDNGNIHTETGAAPIGLEIQALAFAFATTDAINNMTFYKYRVINRGTLALTNTYMAIWVDADLGFYADDYVGCDTSRGLGFCYNGDNYDDPPSGYGTNPPAIGTDFFQGPIADNGQRLKMTNFMYYENDFSVRGNPTNAIHFYNYMRSIWKDGTPLAYIPPNGGNGYGTGTIVSYIYTGMPSGQPAVDACPYNVPQAGWDEASVGNPPFDRRYLQAAGPFTLLPGAVNDIIIGVPWARDANGAYGPGGDGRLGSVCLLYQADDIAQTLFDNNFQLVEGPDAPDLEIVELDRELILKWGYKSPLSNNFNENYRQRDPVLSALGRPDPFYRFEGYLVYQLRDATVSITDLEDPNKAALIAQCDLKNGISTIVNRTEQSVPGYPTPLIVDKVMVNGRDEGLFYSLRVTEDKFTETTDPRLVNYRRYYFMIVAYAYNGDSANYRRFILGRNNIRSYEAVPHKVEFEKMGMVLNAQYGDAPKIQRISGRGNGGNPLMLTPESEMELLSNPTPPNGVTYAPGQGPFAIKVVDPKLFKPYDYRLVVNTDTTQRDTIVSANGDTTILVKEWELYARPAGSGASYQLIYTSWASIGKGEWDYAANTWNFLRDRYQQGIERVIPGHGISVALRNAPDPGARFLRQSDYPWLCPPPPAGKTTFFMDKAENNGLIKAEIAYQDPSKEWIGGFDPETYKWLESFRNSPPPAYPSACFITGDPNDPPAPGNNPWTLWYDFDKPVFKKALLGAWAPYGLLTPYDGSAPEFPGMGFVFCPLTSGGTCSPLNALLAGYPTEFVTLAELPSVEIVITPDPTKWSRCLVVEASPTPSLSQLVGSSFPRTAKFRLSRDILSGDTLAYRNEALSVSSQGFSYFPGYAINLETGQRVNIFFAEASWFRGENGDDMLFNPTSRVAGDALGGRHWVFVTTQPYDGCQSFARYLCVADSTPKGSGAVQQRGIVFGDPAGSGTVRLDSVYKYVAWAGLLRVAGPQYEFRHYKDIPTEARIRLLVNKSYRNDPNGNPPVFSFTTSDISARIGDVATAKNALDLIRVVPNPYYGRSGVGRGVYEISQVDTRVKITNLPQKCTIRIFTLNGVLVRTFRKDSDAPAQEWDLKNEHGVPIASGPYIIHIDAPGLGQKVVKFFAIMPQVDLNNY